MSDRSSESSGEWVILNEDDADLSSETNEEPLNLELNYDAICDAVSDSIRSSLTSEELEWQYEQFEDYIPTYLSHVEDLDPKDFAVEGIKDTNINPAGDDDLNKCCLINDYEEKDIDLAPEPKVRCYKHDRNDHLNFILNLMLALVVSSAVGLALGHFLGWSHKCYSKVTEINEAAIPDNLPDIVMIKQSLNDVLGESEQQMVIPQSFCENLSASVSCLNSRDKSNTVYEEISSVQSDNIVTEPALPETPIFMSSDVLEFKNHEIIHNISDSNSINTPSVISHFNWDTISNNDVLVKREISPVEVNDNLFFKNKMKHDEFELPNEFYIKFQGTFKDVRHFHSSQETFNTKNLKDESNNSGFEFLNPYIEETFYHENNLTDQLRYDLNRVIQSLSSAVLKHLTVFNEKYTTSVEDSKLIVKLYSDFQDLINIRINDVDNFVHSAEYKPHEKSSSKYLHKMVYCLVDSVDHLMKISFKPLSKENKKINLHKFSNNISKVIFNFNKKWEKSSKFWVEAMEKAKFRKFRERSFKNENKQWKKKAQFEKGNYKSNKFRRYAMKS